MRLVARGRTAFVLSGGASLGAIQVLGMLANATTLLIQHRMRAELEARAGQAELVVLPPPCPLRVPPFDFSHADLLISRALDDARLFLDGHETPLPSAA